MERIKAYTLSDDIIGLRFTTGTISEGNLEPYREQSGDRIVSSTSVLMRNGQSVGTVATDPEGQTWLTRFDQFNPDPAADFFEGASIADADRKASYEIKIDNGASTAPQTVWRKTTLVKTAQTGFYDEEFVKQHDVYLKLGTPLREGQEIDISIDHRNLTDVGITFDSNSQQSEAVHVALNGFRAGDSVKEGYLSTWLGKSAQNPNAADDIDYQTGTDFHLRDANTGRVHYTGQVELDKAESAPSNFTTNFNGSNVYKLDFSDFEREGDYVLQVDGVGTSMEFSIHANAWQDPFEAVMQGFYNHRSGIELTSEYTDYDKPRSFHPDDGFVIRQSEATLMDTNQGLNLRSQNSFTALKDGATNEVIDEAWGGWHDAGDWDRRAQHLETARELIELAELNKDWAEKTSLSIPEKNNNLPDIIDEALWAVDFYQRLQKSDGGIPGGVEASRYPNFGETSWTAEHDLFVYAPDAWSSYLYAGAAARAAHAVEDYDAARARSYENSAKKAMVWAEANLPDYAADVPDVVNARNVAAAELYRQTGEQRFHDIFLDSSSYTDAGRSLAWNEHQYDSTAIYNDTDFAVNTAVLNRAKADVEGQADYLITTGDRGAYGQIINPYAPQGWSYTSAVPNDAASILVKAHMISGKDAYYDAIIADSQFGLGANPYNMSFMTGYGERTVEEALVVDSEALGDKTPDGVPLFGLWNYLDRGGHYSFAKIDSETFGSFPNDYPVNESYQGYTKAVPLTEYSINGTLGLSAYAWGYLAATGESDPGSSDGGSGGGGTDNGSGDGGSDNGSGNETASNTLSWAEDSSTSSYRLHARPLGGSKTLDVKVKDSNPGDGEVSFEVTTLDPGIYEYRYRPIYDDGPGSFAQWQRFEVKEDPGSSDGGSGGGGTDNGSGDGGSDNGSGNETASNTLSWAEDSSTSSYRLHARPLGGSKTLDVKVKDSNPGDGEVSFEVTTLDPGIYEYRYRPIYDDGPGSFAQWQRFEVKETQARSLTAGDLFDANAEPAATQASSSGSFRSISTGSVVIEDPLTELS